MKFPICTLTISLFLDDLGDPFVGLEVDGEASLIEKLGMLDMSRDTLLNPPTDDGEAA